MAREDVSSEEVVSLKKRVRTRIREDPVVAEASLKAADAVGAKEEAVAKEHQEMICGTSGHSMWIEHPRGSSLTRAR